MMNGDQAAPTSFTRGLQIGALWGYIVFSHLLRSEWINPHWWSRPSEHICLAKVQNYKVKPNTGASCIQTTETPLLRKPKNSVGSSSGWPPGAKICTRAHTHALQLSTPICSCLPISQRLSWEKNFSPAALLLLTPASFRYDNLVNPTKTVYMPGNGTFKWLTTCYLCCPPRCCKTQYQKIILRRRGPLSLHGSRGLFCTGALEEAARQDLAIEQKGGKKNSSANTCWSSIIIIKLGTSACKLAAIALRVNFIDIRGT